MWYQPETESLRHLLTPAEDPEAANNKSVVGVMTTCGQHIREQTSDRTQRRRVRRAEEHQAAACRLTRDNA
jgi:hypothetical protein